MSDLSESISSARQWAWRLVFTLTMTVIWNVSQAQNSPKIITQRATDLLRRLPSSYVDDRCALGVSLSDNNYIVVTYSPEARQKFALGDRLLTVNGESVLGGLSTYFEVLSRIPPDAVTRVKVERARRTDEFDYKCVNARPYAESMVRIFEAMKKKDWHGCVAAIRDAQALWGVSDSLLASAYLDCGSHAEDFVPAQFPTAAYEYWRLTIEENQWDPVTWPRTRGEVLGALTAFEQNGQFRLAADLQRQLDAVENRQLSTSTDVVPSKQLQPSTPVGSGTGFLVDGNGTVITSHHVVAGARTITARCNRGDAVPARIASTNQTTDIAVLSTGIKNLPYHSLARPRSATVGQRIFTYGFPVTEILGADPKFTDGTISALSGLGGEQTYLQISVPVQPGNSGGPVVSETAEVVGIVAAAAAIAPFLENTGTLPQNINWAVKAEYAALMFDAPQAQPRASSREEAIARVEQSLCFIEVR